MSLKTMLGELLAPVFRKREDVLLCKELKAEPGQASTGRLEAVPVGSQHLKALVQFIHEHHGDVARSLRMLDDCFRNRYEGRVAFLDGQVIGYRWWVTHTMSHPQLKLYHLTLREDEVFAFGLYIARAYRAHGYATEFLAITQQQLLDLGYKRLYNAVGAGNVPARRLYESFGSKELGLRVSVSFFSLAACCGGRWLRYDPVWM
jgi:GNAT superfamily N-acetyltransferase